MSLYESQIDIYQQIERIKSNFKKDSASRKTVDYYEIRIASLDTLWDQFKRNHENICIEERRTHQYFTEMWFEKTQENYKEIREMLLKNYEKLRESFYQAEGSTTAPSTSQAKAECKQPKEREGQGDEIGEQENQNNRASTSEAQKFFISTGTNSKYDELLRKQQVNIKVLNRTMENIDVEEISEKWEYEDALKSLQARWDAVDKLHWEMDEFEQTNKEYASTFFRYERRYIELKKSLNKRMNSVSHREKSTPKVDIPIFTGNYNQWMSFKDLFDEAIHRNPALSNAQKMQFLRGKVRGEAERLIQHLPISTSNYEVCWDILKNRYHNKKLIFTSHISLLLGLPSMTTLSAPQIKKLHDVTQESLNAIKNLGVNISTWDPLLVHLLSQKLDTETYTDYIESLSNSRELPVLQDFLRYLECKFTALESARRKQDAGSVKSRQQSENQQVSTMNKNRYQTNRQQASTSGVKYEKHFKQSFPTYQARSQFNSNKNQCPICNKYHGIFHCQQFLEMSNDAKRKSIAQLNLCKNCLYSHNGRVCISNKRCRTCQGDHNTILHEAYTLNTLDRTESAGNAHVARTRDTCEVLLATALIKVQAADGTYQTMRALIDQGSQTSLITERGAQSLGLARQRCKGVITGVGEKTSQCKGALELNCMSMDESYTFSTYVYIMTNLIKNLPSNTISKPNWDFLASLKLADDAFHISRSVDVLLGAEIYSNIIQGGICRSEHTSIVAQQTRLGWILCGTVTPSLQCNVIMNNIEQIERFWKIEDISEESNLTSEDQHCVDFYQKTTKRSTDGNYVVRLPLKPDYEYQLGNSKSKAIAQFLHLERKLSKQLTILQQYKYFIEQYIALRHMKLSKKSAGVECYLPHHCVIRDDSTTTSLRVVFNASAPTSNKTSLNDVMLRGPNLQKDLMSLVIKWRQYRIAFTADIEKMFRQIWVHENDQSLQKIIWRFNSHEPLQEYQLTTITYGTKAAPFLAMMTLQQLARDEQQNYPEAARVLENAFYMDDLIHGAHSVDTAYKIKQDLIDLLKRGGFNLRKWSSNASEILQSDKNHQQNFEFRTEPNQKALGLQWNPNEDVFSFQAKIENTTEITTTKRVLLSEISKLFDPLGWLSPVTIKLKLLFQEVWQRNIQWDENIPEDLQAHWSKIKEDICNINNIKLSRWLYTAPLKRIELHGYCDASMKAYACTIYCKTNDNKINLVVAKTRLVSRNKKVTLPKLELCGAHLLSSLMERTLQCLSGYDIKVFGWCDSTAVLGWIQGGPNKWKSFVSKRVGEISKIIPPNNWRYVKSSDNPADCATRGITALELQEYSLWWQGPLWLLSNEYEIQQSSPAYETKEELKIQQKIASNVRVDDSIVEDLLNTYSSFRKLVRILAWVRRVRIPKQERKPYLTLAEIKQSTSNICKHVQQNKFGDDINKLSEKNSINSKSKIFGLNPFLDGSGLLRVGGRLRNANIHPEMKNPIIIPHESRLTDLIIDNAHELTFHGGTRLTLSFLRRRYWIVGGTQAVKKRLRNCVICKKHNPKINNQLMSDLPSSRTNPSRPFYNTGMDLTGHLEVKSNKGRGIKTTKGYVAVFVCMATKAVHLELVSDLTSSTFLAAFRRMASRRGTPRNVYCDNGTNFVGANKMLQQEQIRLKEIIDARFYTEITEMEVQFHFNAPAWPSAGGLWEAAVKSLKRHLKTILGAQKFTYEELSTLLSQIEACLNSRPLCPLTEDPEDFNYLTPSHFLASGPILTIIETEQDHRTRWEYTQRIFREIWKRWSTEYLTQLSQRTKWRKARDNIKINDLAMIHDANLPPGKWAMGRVVDVHPGKDGHIRVVTLKTKSGYIKRPIIKISVLPIKTSESTISNNETTQSEQNAPAKQHTMNKQTVAMRKTKKCTNKTSLASIALTLLYFMAITLPTQASVNITSFNKNQALYLDLISKMQTVRDEWTLVVYYDMSPYWEGIKAYEKITTHLNDTCLNTENNNCNIIVSQLTHDYNELLFYNNILLRQQFNRLTPHAHARQRRGLINGVGYIANSLFGVLDERFAEQYTKDITQMKQNEAHLVTLWQNQKSIVEAESNLLQRTADIMQKHHKHIDKQLLSLKQANDVLKVEVSRIATIQEFMLLSLSASNLVHNLKSTQDNLLDALTDIYHGQFQLHLLTPEQLVHELYIISGHVASDVRLPISDLEKDVSKIYKLIKVKARMTSKYLIFEVKFPLVSRDKYKLYQIIPVPQQVNKTMVTVVPVADYISINNAKEKYLTMTHTDLSLCTLHDDTYMCTEQRPIYYLLNNKKLCDINLETEQCNVRRSMCRNQWHTLSNPAQFLFFCCNTYTAKIICEEDVTMQQLSMSGIISLAPNCIIKGDDFSLASHTAYQNRLNVSSFVFIPQIDHINHMINISIPEEGGNDTDTKELSATIHQLKQKIEDMKGDYQPNFELSTHDVSQYVCLSLMFAGALVVGGVFFWKRFYQQRGQRVITPDIELQSMASGDLRRNNSRRVQPNEVSLQQTPFRVNKACSPFNMRRTEFSSQ